MSVAAVTLSDSLALALVIATILLGAFTAHAARQARRSAESAARAVLLEHMPALVPSKADPVGRTFSVLNEGRTAAWLHAVDRLRSS